jgi:hypothetical protein
MSLADKARFAIGVVFVTPILATEDALRYFGAPVSKHGFTKDDDGKGIFEIWQECAPKPVEKPTVTVTPSNDSIRQRVDEINQSLRAMAEGLK